METEFPLTEDIRSNRDSRISTVLVRTADEGNRRQLTRWLTEQESYDRVETDIRTGEFDCCILDWATLLDNQGAIRTRKQAERIPLPFVLLVPEQRADEITKALQDDARDLHSLVDELLRMPVSELELEQRLESVLRARHQAVVLDEEHEQLHAIRDNHRGHGVILTNTDGIIEYVNRGFEQQSGYSNEEVLGKTPNVLNSGEHDESFFADLWETITSGEKWHGEVINDRKDGEQYVVDQVIVPLTGPEGEIEQFVAVNHEITELRELANSLNEQRDQLELLNRVLRHDIRNDMSVILGWMEILDAHVDSDGEEMLDRVLTSGRHVVELTDVAKTIVEAIFEEEDVSLESVELGSLLETVIETRKETFDQATIRMDGRPPAVTVEANEMLSAVFRNLINNAVQHNDADEPKVTISSQVDDGSVRIRVADNGPGIPDDQRDQIFDSDEKGLDSTGTGMGLYLVTNLVDMYDGSVWIEDNDPHGAVFVVDLPTSDSSSGDASE
ncbi:PAS domain-containing sensor histidine kinase [Halosimplex rubrum]|uniref:histidine kinase n=1 Tax=Halosimplex rubrum TaxID=869889 RepID=A0A7D5SY98_9EURY|nr:PAS domain-containing sensor histidine kinase [Halosimplex rubrum]QLH77731.1 PAS domain-containing sensor histidine kinase [Halosimplex rubrum]